MFDCELQMVKNYPQQITFRHSQQLRELGVSLIYLFGSVAEGNAHDLSDLDIGIVLQSEPSNDVSVLYNTLYDIFTEIFPGEKVDIVFLQRTGLEMRFDAVTHGILLFEAGKNSHYDFAERIRLLYADFQPHLKEFDEQVLERIH